MEKFSNSHRFEMDGKEGERDWRKGESESEGHRASSKEEKVDDASYGRKKENARRVRCVIQYFSSRTIIWLY